MKDAFIAFSKRSIFEVPPNVFCSSPTLRSERSVLALKCVEGVISTLENVKDVQEKSR